eukprot:TRINITY_DN30303_c0_g1_i1.p1 TRINITY_DN30303_c0_g1~~TRINITY_DN30303_c0_g1_i1.p1  ORF type:complete len:225 (+),score=36.48 TRINITY_DN30303_c0_g1_i1:93-677(+)
MARKKHGSSNTPVQRNLRWGCDRKLADQICNFNRKFAETTGHFRTLSFLEDAQRALNRGESKRVDGTVQICCECDRGASEGFLCNGFGDFFCKICWSNWERFQGITFYDSNSGEPLFFAPSDRSFTEFLDESTRHGWPSFRDAEVNWEFVRVLSDGETVSVRGTHLGHNIPDKFGNRYCINLVSVAGRPPRQLY